jgi:hypothetical protein
MPAQYPDQIPDLAASVPSSGTAASTPLATDHDDHHRELEEELIAIATELGVNPSSGFSNVSSRLDSMGSLGGELSADVAPARLAFPFAANGRYNWNSGNSLFSNADWQVGGVLATNSVLTAWRRPVGSYSNADRELCILHDIPGEPFGTFENDSHNQIIVGVDSNDNVIVFANHHNDPLNWVWWDASQVGADFTDPTQWEVGGTMAVAGDEDQVTYFTFIYEPVSDRLLLFHSNGVGAGNTSRYLNLWDGDGTWTRVCHLFDGESTSPTQTAYPHYAIREDGMIGIFFTWHEWGDPADTDHDLCYAQSPDGGITWERIDGSNYDLPIRFDTGDNHEAEIIYPIAAGTSFVHGGSACFDADGYPWSMQIGPTQQRYVIRWNGTAWVNTFLPTEYNNAFGPTGVGMFSYGGRVYAPCSFRQNGRELDLIFLDVTNPEAPVEILISRGLATPGTGMQHDWEAFRRRNVWERMIGPSRDADQEFSSTQVPYVMLSIDLNQLAMLRTGNLQPVGILPLYNEMSKQGDYWTAAGTGLTLLPQAPAWSLYPDGDLRNGLVVARIHAWGTIATSNTMRVAIMSGYSPAYGGAIDVHIASVNITNAVNYASSSWNAVPVIPFGGGTLFPYHIACAAAVTGSATGTISELFLEVGVIPGPRWAAT